MKLEGDGDVAKNQWISEGNERKRKLEDDKGEHLVRERETDQNPMRHRGKSLEVGDHNKGNWYHEPNFTPHPRGKEKAEEDFRVFSHKVKEGSKGELELSNQIV